MFVALSAGSLRILSYKQSTHSVVLLYSIYIKVSFFVQCIKKQLITLQNFNTQTCYSQFLWFFSLKFSLKGQIISRIHLILPNAYKLMCFDRNINGNFWSVIFCWGRQILISKMTHTSFFFFPLITMDWHAVWSCIHIFHNNMRYRAIFVKYLKKTDRKYNHNLYRKWHRRCLKIRRYN